MVQPWSTKHNPTLREVDLEPSLEIGSDKIKMLKQARKNAEKNTMYRFDSHMYPRTYRGRLGTQC